MSAARQGQSASVQSQMLWPVDAFVEIRVSNCRCEGRILIFMAVENDYCITRDTEEEAEEEEEEELKPKSKDQRPSRARPSQGDFLTA